MPDQTTNTVLMIRPKQFGFNHQTAISNTFQQSPKDSAFTIAQQAIQEFDQLVDAMQVAGIQVIVIDDQDDPRITDSIFPNNWVSFNHDGSIYWFPMESENRRLEKRDDIHDVLRQTFKVKTIFDLSESESKNQFLEGTGSMIFDHVHKKVYACLSSRTNIELLQTHANDRGYEPVIFHAFNQSGISIYHTNVMMSIGSQFVVICLSSITDETERSQVIKSLTNGGKKIIDLNWAQMNQFAGNMLELKNRNGDAILVMSLAARNSLNAEQQEQLSTLGRIVSADLSTIERVGGGSARCMIAEVFLPKK